MANVFIIESDADFAGRLAATLRERGHQTTVLDNGNDAVARANEAPPAVFVLCAELPKLSGFSVCNRLKRDASLQSIPVVMISANASEETFEQHRRLPKKSAQAYLHKPIEPAELAATVEQLLGIEPHSAQQSERAPVRNPMESGVVLEARAAVAEQEEDLDELLNSSLEDIPLDEELMAHVASERVPTTAVAEPAEPKPAELAALTGERDALRAELTALTEERDVLRAESASLAEERDGLRAEAAGLGERLASVERARDDATTAASAVGEAGSSQEAEIATLKRRLAEAQSEAEVCASVRDQLAATEGQAAHFETEAERLATELEAALGRCGDAGREAAKMQGKIATLEGRLRDGAASFEQLAAKEKAVSEELASARAELGTARESTSRAEASLKQEQEARARAEADHAAALAESEARAERALTEANASHQSELAEANASHGSELAEANASGARALAEADELNQQALAQWEASHRQALAKAEAHRQQGLAEAEDARQAVEAERDAALSEADQRGKKLQELDATLQRQESDASANAERLEQALAEAEERITKLRAEHEAASAEVQRLGEQIAALGTSHEQEVGNLRAQLGERDQRVSTLESEQAALGTELDQIRTDFESEKTAAAAFRERVRDALGRVSAELLGERDDEH